MKQYQDLLARILGSEGQETIDRTGVGTRSIFGAQLSFDLEQAFPLVTLKKTLYKAAFIEMLWFLRGEPNLDYLKKHNVSIWDEWANEQGYLGPIYGVQWRSWKGKIHRLPATEVGQANSPSWATFENYLGREDHRTANGESVLLYQEEIDQIKQLIETIKKNPTSRRHIVSAWNPGLISDMALPPCHRDFQCYTPPDGTLSLMVNIRSSDTMLGLPFNIAQYALLTHLLAQVTGRKAKRLVVTLGDAHIYMNHIAAAKELVEQRQPLEPKAKLVISNPTTDIDAFKPEDFSIENYESHPFIKLEVAV